jgi:hypothetical protein
MLGSSKTSRPRTAFSKGRVFRVVVGLMVISTAVLVALCIWGNNSQTQQQTASLCSDFLKAGFASLLTLLGSRAK